MIVKREKEIVIVIFLKFVDEEKKRKISSFLVVVSLIIIEKYKIIIEYTYTQQLILKYYTPIRDCFFH